MTVRRTGSQGQRVLSGQGTCQLRAEGPEGPAQSATGRVLGGEWWCQVAEAHPALCPQLHPARSAWVRTAPCTVSLHWGRCSGLSPHPTPASCGRWRGCWGAEARPPGVASPGDCVLRREAGAETQREGHVKTQVWGCRGTAEDRLEGWTQARGRQGPRRAAKGLPVSTRGQKGRGRGPR